MSANLGPPIRAALVGEAAITALLPAYLDGYPIFTQRPVPDNAEYPMIVVSPDVATSEQDGIADFRPVLERDVAVYGRNNTAANYAAVETIARLVHDLFHRQRNSIAVSGWGVVDVVARSPMPAPTDDEKTVGRVVPLTIRLAKLN